MILKSLADYYQRKQAENDHRIPLLGYEYRAITFILVLSENGTLINIEDTRRPNNNGRGLVASSFMVPMHNGRTSANKPILLWDTIEYVIGLTRQANANQNQINAANHRHELFQELVNSVSTLIPDDFGIIAVNNFLNNLQENPITEDQISLLREVNNAWISFKLQGNDYLVCQSQKFIDSNAVFEYLNKHFAIAADEPEEKPCLITGNNGVISNLHPLIQGVQGAKPTGANIVSFNKMAFESYGMRQGKNAPITINTTLAYTTALRHLLRRDSSQKLKIGDTTTIFWSDQQNHLENEFSLLFKEPSQDNPDQLTETVNALLQAVDNGQTPPEDNTTNFFILGLSPSAARIAIRFWHAGTVSDFSKRIYQHFKDLEITRGQQQGRHLSLWRLLRSVAVLGKSENIPPNLAGDWIRTIFSGILYPETLFQSAIRRIHAERKVTYERAAIIKACINRKARMHKKIEEELTVSLDTNNKSISYLLGRLFATLERIQETSSPGLNATIRDRYYPSASCTPSNVFPILLRLKNHHLRKLEKGKVIYFEKIIGEILNQVPSEGMPVQLNLAEQGRFAIGYYHQCQDFFTHH